MKTLEEAFDYLRQVTLDKRISVAQARDDMLTHDEILAVLEVYSEFGR